MSRLLFIFELLKSIQQELACRSGDCQKQIPIWILVYGDHIRSVSGGARRDRTADLLRARQALSQLSYGPKKQLRVTSN